MFKIGDSDSYDWLVKGRSAAETGGGFLEFSFTGRFKRIDADVVERIIVSQNRYAHLLKNGLTDDALKEENMEDDRIVIPWRQADVARFVLVGWGDEVQDSDGNSIDFSLSILNEMLKRSGVGQAICEAWMASLDFDSKKPKPAARKNF
jgi:hypothetical protein